MLAWVAYIWVMTVIIVIVLSDIFPLKGIYESVPYLYDYVLLFVLAVILA